MNNITLFNKFVTILSTCFILIYLKYGQLISIFVIFSTTRLNVLQ